MNIIYFMLGIAVCKKLLKDSSQIKSKVTENNDKKDRGVQVAKTRKTYTTYIKNEDIGPQVQPGNFRIKIKPDYKNIQETSQPNFLALCVLWSHFQALENNILKENLPAPWEQYEENKFISNKKPYLIKQRKWKRFLEEIIQDKSWVRWINNSGEVRKRSLIAYEKVH